MYSDEIISNVGKAVRIVDKKIDIYYEEVVKVNDKISKYKHKIDMLEHKSKLLKLYTKKIQQIDQNITLLELLKIIINDIQNDDYDSSYDVLKTTKMDNITVLKSNGANHIKIHIKR